MTPRVAGGRICSNRQHQGVSIVLEEYSLKGKVAVVTGSGRGIGRGIALTLAEAASDMVTGQNIYIDGGLTSGG